MFLIGSSENQNFNNLMCLKANTILLKIYQDLAGPHCHAHFKASNCIPQTFSHLS
jgi:hypothetical protein